mmetsp:Transcript_7775/g.18028  ORF Transcript_7775/g.18028 Transcript_7775/m.18028 type:complete len:218 (-) Transcript_7775:2228-2881(-)
MPPFSPVILSMPGLTKFASRTCSGESPRSLAMVSITVSITINASKCAGLRHAVRGHMLVDVTLIVTSMLSMRYTMSIAPAIICAWSAVKSREDPPAICKSTLRARIRPLASTAAEKEPSSSCRPPTMAMSCSRVSTSRTGRWNCLADRQAASATGMQRVIFPPKPPPTRRNLTVTWFWARPRVAATILCGIWVPWVDMYRTIPLSSSGHARADCGSM